MSEPRDLADRQCVPCRGGVAPHDRAAADRALAELPGWTLDANAAAISRRWTFKGFARAMQAANAVAWVAEREGHHPDLRVGWGYCEVSFTTHEAGGLTDNDLICAAKVSRLLG